jgi:hypothetical protein
LQNINFNLIWIIFNAATVYHIEKVIQKIQSICNGWCSCWEGILYISCFFLLMHHLTQYVYDCTIPRTVLFNWIFISIAHFIWLNICLIAHLNMIQLWVGNSRFCSWFCWSTFEWCNSSVWQKNSSHFLGGIFNSSIAFIFICLPISF